MYLVPDSQRRNADDLGENFSQRRGRVIQAPPGNGGAHRPSGKLNRLDRLLRTMTNIRATPHGRASLLAGGPSVHRRTS